MVTTSAQARRSRCRSGFGLLEVLIALALASAVLALLAAVSVRVRRSAALAEEAAYRAQIRASAEAIFRIELSRAGPAPVGTPVSLEPDPPLVAIILDSAGSDAISVRYLDVPYQSEPSVREVELSAGRDSRGRPALYLRLDGAARQPALEGVTRIELRSLLFRGSAAAPSVGELVGVDGVVLGVTYVWGEVAELAVPLGSSMTVAVR